jgi:hypothetical protein
MGTLELYLIYNYDGLWEEQWRTFQNVWDLPEVTKDVMDMALHRLTRPLVEALGPPPKGVLLKLPIAARSCMARERCPFFNKRRCGILLKQMPWCFVPDQTPAENLGAELIKLWREGVYVVVVREPPHESLSR